MAGGHHGCAQEEVGAVVRRRAVVGGEAASAGGTWHGAEPDAYEVMRPTETATRRSCALAWKQFAGECADGDDGLRMVRGTWGGRRGEGGGEVRPAGGDQVGSQTPRRACEAHGVFHCGECEACEEEDDGRGIFFEEARARTMMAATAAVV